MELAQQAQPAIQTVGTLGGLASDLYGGYQNFRNMQEQRQTSALLGNPGNLADYTNKLYQPLSAAAQMMVNRGINANTALRGVSQGGYAGQFAADALARLESQRQQAAQAQAMAALTNRSQQMPLYQPNGLLGGVLNSMAALRQIRGQQQTPWSQQLAQTPGTGGGMPGGMNAPGYEGNMYAEDPTDMYLGLSNLNIGPWGAGSNYLAGG